MKICFWSNVRGKTGVTTNLGCISTMTALSRQGRSVLLENHYSIRGLGDILLPAERNTELREYGGYFSHSGIEYVMKRMYSGEPGEKLIHQTAVPLLFTTMLYLPQGRIVNREVFDYEFHLVQEEMFQILDQMADYVFVDTETNRNLSSRVLLSEADLVVVNLDQEPEHLKDFFENYSSIQDKAVYVIGNYKSELPWNLNKICKEYAIPGDKIGIVPYHMGLEDAMLQGRLLQFLNCNYYEAPDRETEEFIRYVKRAAGMMRKNALQIRRKRGNIALASASQRPAIMA